MAQVNVDSKTYDLTVDCLRKANTDTAKRHAFTCAEEHVFTLMSKDSYPRFVRSQIYKVLSIYYYFIVIIRECSRRHSNREHGG